MTRKSERRKGRWKIDAAGAAGCLLLSLVGYTTIIAPMRRAAAEIHALESELTVEQQRSKQVERSRGRHQRALARLQSDLGATALELEPVNRLNRRLARIVELASTSGLQIHETRSGKTTSGAYYDTVPLDLTGEGSYPNCAVFLRRLSEELPDVAVLGFDLTGDVGRLRAEPGFQFRFAWYAATAQDGGVER